MPATETSPPYPYQHQRIRFKDLDSGKTLVFLTSNMLLPTLNIAALYQSRWQVELFFKWIKQHLRIRKFLGSSENAVKTQIWCAVSTWRAHRHRQERASTPCLALYASTDSFGLGFRENRDFMRLAARSTDSRYAHRC